MQTSAPAASDEAEPDTQSGGPAEPEEEEEEDDTGMFGGLFGRRKRGRFGR